MSTPQTRPPIAAPAAYERFASLALRLGAGIALAWLMTLAWDAFFALRPQTRLARISVQLEPDTQTVLGRNELAAPAADLLHLKLGRDARGAWWLANVSGDRAVEIERVDRSEYLLRSLPLEPGQRMLVAGQPWLVQQEGPNLLLNREGTTETWHFDGVTLARRSGEGRLQVLPPCSDARRAEHLRAAWNGWTPPWATVRRPLHWGGLVACGLNLPHPGLQPGSLQIQREGITYRLLSHASAARQVCLTASDTPGHCPHGASLFERQELMAGVTHLTVGRTRFAVHIDAEDTARLHLRPVHRAGWVQATIKTSTQLQWETRLDEPWRWAWPGGAALWAAATLLLAACMAAVAWRRRLSQQQGPLALWALWTVAQWFALAVYLRGGELGLGWVLALASVAAGSVLLTPQRTGWAWGAHVLLVLMWWAGLLLHWQLGLQAQDSGGWAYFRTNAVVGAAGLFALQAFAWGLRAKASSGAAQCWPDVRPLEAALTMPGVLALALLALQAVFGAEEGVFGFQPVELAKLALVLLGAHALALRLEWVGPGGWRNWPRQWALALRLAMPVLLFFALAVSGLMWVQDFSPLVLLTAWLLGLLAAWALARASVPALVPLLLIAGLAVPLWHWARGDGLAWLQAMGLYAERFAAWVDLPHHPHSGEQVLHALQLATADGHGSQAQALARRVPAVQDDMAPAFLLGRFGFEAGMALVIGQLSYIACLLLLGWQALQAAGPGDYRKRWGLRLIFFAAWGAAALFIAHVAVSWGSSTGGLPVMGQPMPLVSAGGSVIALLLVPLHLLWMVQPELLRHRPPGSSGTSA